MKVAYIVVHSVFVARPVEIGLISGFRFKLFQIWKMPSYLRLQICIVLPTPECQNSLQSQSNSKKITLA